MGTTTKRAAKRRQREGGDRLVQLTDGTQYVTQFNTTFGIIQLGDRGHGWVMTLAQAVDVIKDIGRFGVHRLWPELEPDQSV